MRIILASVIQVWYAQELHTLVLLSLTIQIFLIFLATRRRYSASRRLSIFLWSFYLVADYIATLALGYLLKRLKYGNDDDFRVNAGIIALWAPFLLLHLGGPDTITAYSIEDNELWWRHCMTLLLQVGTAIAVFFLSPPNARLWKVALPVYVAGIIKYAERTLSLRSASMDHLMGSMITEPDPGPSYTDFMEDLVAQEESGIKIHIQIEPEPQSAAVEPGHNATEENISDAEIICKAFHFFGTFKRMVVGLILTFLDRTDTQSFFLKCSSKQAFQVVDIEVSFLFDLLYTKAALTYNYLGVTARCTSFAMTLLSLLFFYCCNKSGYADANVIITYVLLIVALGLESVSFTLLFLSDRAFIWLEHHSRTNFFFKMVFEVQSRFKLPVGSRWSNRMWQYNLISLCLRDQFSRFKSLRKILKLLSLLDNWDYTWHTKRVVLTDGLKERIFDELKKKAKNAENTRDYKCFNTCRGDWVLQQEGYQEILGRSIVEAEFDESVFLWHIATDLCYYAEDTAEFDESDTKIKKDRDASKAKREEERDAIRAKWEQDRDASKAISDYMMYLLVQRPFMLPAGIGKIRFGDTCAEAKKVFKQEKLVMDAAEVVACDMLLEVDTRVPPIEVKGDRSKSILFDGCILAKELRTKVHTKERWGVVSAVWVEMLCYAANQCRGNVHAKQLSSGGGEFLTHVWFLIAHMGMGEHYRTEAGHARAKLITEK